ncbi:MAG TPA: hypothetical protein VD884_20765 [Ohtaekwangia sp.]|nr:hypothetical protein [Ohtaekwangia sp.]
MSYKPDEQELMAYLYGELEGDAKARLDKYFLANPEVRKEYEHLESVSQLLRHVKDKEVIAPPVFVDDNKQRWISHAPYLKTIMGIAASLVFVILIARITGTQVSVSNHEFKISFGTPQTQTVATPEKSELTATHVQQMINESLEHNNDVLNANWQASHHALESSIKTNLMVNSGKMDQVVREASTASQEQIQAYVATLQAENMKLVKDYFKLTAGEQKQYIEGLLVDFAKYLQQQRNDDLQLVQVRLNNLEQNTTVFKQETEQILTNIISTVGNNQPTQIRY